MCVSHYTDHRANNALEISICLFSYGAAIIKCVLVISAYNLVIRYQPQGSDGSLINKQQSIQKPAVKCLYTCTNSLPNK